MQKTILRYGLWSAALAALFLTTMVVVMRWSDNYRGNMFVGFAGIILSMVLVFFGIRHYRDHECGGQITFGRALQVGIGIALISCVGYVLAWMVVWPTLVPDFMDRYTATMLEELQKNGADATAIQVKTAEFEQMRRWYQNPLMVAALTFLEPLPVALLVTLISALALRRRAPNLEMV